MKKTKVLIATFFNIGKFPIAPGTLASLVTTVVLYCINYLIDPHIPVRVISIILIFLIGIPCAKEAEKFFNKKDPGAIVIDEVAGQMLTFLLVDAYLNPKSLLIYIIGFFLFRFFDILKPFPVNLADRIQGGFGIMFDDIVAAVYSLGTLQLVISLFHLSS